jgi:diguanylate cyclase (GGDEF)-like protein
MLKQSLFAKTFVTIVIALSLWVIILYLSSVPFVNELSFNIEEKAGRTILENVFQLVKQGDQDIRSWEQLAMKARKRELRNITQVAEDYLHALQKDVANGILDPEQAQQQALRHIRNFQYGNNDYVWVSDYNSVLISHPDPKLHNQDFSRITDIDGRLIVPPMIKGAREQGEGFHTYSWHRLGSSKAINKLTFYKNVPEWKWVIGTGVYTDDIDEEVARRKQRFIEELRDHLRHTPVANTGYIYVFDSNMNMIIHPNSNIENTRIEKLLDPVTQRPIADELIAAAQTSDNELHYMWDKPSDPGHYVYDKISWIKYFKPFDWYIVSSVYTEELERGGRALAHRLLALSLVGLIITIGIAWLFVRALITPIKKLATAAESISHGDLSRKTRLNRKDELGTLGEAFNLMVDELRDQIDLLEHRVAERTGELTSWVAQLENRNREIAIFNSMSEWLLACRNESEAYAVLKQAARKLFPEQAGEVLMLKNEGQTLELVDSWGMVPPLLQKEYGFDDCLALRRGSLYYTDHPGQGLDCHHLPEGLRSAYLCAPITASGEVMGVLHIEFITPDALQTHKSSSDLKRFAGSLAEQVALTITNLRLREQLQQQSIRDPLTGLYNRRYLEESLPREEQRARRTGSSVGVIMLDVDHFKQVNDQHGHITGDEILKHLGQLLQHNTRGEDIACRYGGEEFILILPNTSLKDTLRKAETIRQLVETEIMLKHVEGAVRITLSAGVAAYPESGADLELVLQAADNALYQAKKQGRNRVICDPGPEQEPATR